MSRVRFNMKLSVTFIKEGKQFVAYSPALDLSTCGKTLFDARRRFVEAAALFFEELNRRGTTREILRGLGWVNKSGGLISPKIVGQETLPVPA